MADQFATRLEGYVEVPDRIRQFFEQHPEGSLQPAEGYPKWESHGDREWIVYVAHAYRTPEDPRPGVGMAAEPFPGETPYTKDSELMNAETSAWGRALAALGFVGKKVATNEEVQARAGGGNGDEPKITAKQIENFVMRRAKQFGKSREDVDLIVRHRFSVGRLEDLPRSQVEALVEQLANPVPTGESDVPADDEPEPEPVAADPSDPF